MHGLRNGPKKTSLVNSVTRVQKVAECMIKTYEMNTKLKIFEKYTLGPSRSRA